MKKFQLIWLFLCFACTVIISIILGNIGIEGTASYWTRAVAFAGIGFITYTPIKNKFE